MQNRLNNQNRIIDFFNILINSKEAVTFTIFEGILTVPICYYCVKPMNLQNYRISVDGVVWRCSKCKRRINIRRECSLFYWSKLRLGEMIFLLFYGFLNELPLLRIITLTNLNEKTISRWRKKFWNMIDMYLNDRRALGQDGQIIEIDESMFSKRKNNVGRVLPATWVLGIKERGENGLARFIVVPDRSAQTLTAIILENVSQEATLLCTDQWGGYNRLSNEGYTHATVNHSENFVNPDMYESNGMLIPVHTQNIENTWGRLKMKLKRKRGLHRRNIQDHINESHWLIENRLNLIGAMSWLIKNYGNQ